MSNIEYNNMTQDMILHGYRTKKIVPLTNDLIDYMVELILLCNQEQTFCKPVRYENISTVIRMAKQFFIDAGIILNDVATYSGAHKSQLLKCTDLEELVYIYNNNCTYKSPFDIPLEILDTNSFISKLTEDNLILDKIKNNNSLLERLSIAYKNIGISRIIGEVTTASYIHEITKTQLGEEKGSVRDYYNADVLSIFNELLYASHIDNGLLRMILTMKIVIQ